MKIFAIIPRLDMRQAHRVRRYLAAVASSLLVLGLFAVLWSLGYMQTRGFAYAAAGMLLCIVTFYVILRSGLNLRMKDPSLTFAQIASSFVVITCAMYFTADAARDLLLPIFLISFLFGVFRLDMRGMVGIMLFGCVCYALMVALLLTHQPDSVELAREILRLGVIGLALGWFAVMGGYISRLRLQLSASNARLTSALQVAEHLATQDELTGIHNRRSIMAKLREECVRSARTRQLFCVAMIDLDYFKKINDTLGHAAGDLVLQGFCAHTGQTVRETDYFGRYGGEEFLLIMTATSLQNATIGAERVRACAAAACIAGLDPQLHITVSIGLAEHEPGELMERTVNRADAALYDAKAGGRNRVACRPIG